MRHLPAANPLCGLSDTNIINMFRFFRGILSLCIAKNASLPSAGQKTPWVQDLSAHPKRCAEAHFPRRSPENVALCRKISQRLFFQGTLFCPFQLIISYFSLAFVAKSRKNIANLATSVRMVLSEHFTFVLIPVPSVSKLRKVRCFYETSTRTTQHPAAYAAK